MKHIALLKGPLFSTFKQGFLLLLRMSFAFESAASALFTFATAFLFPEHQKAHYDAQPLGIILL